MDKTLEYIHYNGLFDLYGNLLTDREREIFTLFYEEDLSLQEIANERKVSKSAVGKTIQIVEEKLEDYESKLHFSERIIKIENILEKIDNKDIQEKIMEILKD